MFSKSIVIVEKSPELRNILRHAFETKGYLIWTCPEAETATTVFEAIRPSAVILDLDAYKENFLELLDQWHAHDPTLRIIVESSPENSDLLKEALHRGAYAFLLKPYSLAPIFKMLETNSPQEATPRDNTRVA